MVVLAVAVSVLMCCRRAAADDHSRPRHARRHGTTARLRPAARHVRRTTRLHAARYATRHAAWYAARHATVHAHVIHAPSGLLTLIYSAARIL